MVVFMVGLILAAYYLVRKLYGDKIAIASSLLLATFPVFYGNGKNILGEIPGLFYLFIFLFFVNRIETSRGKDGPNYILAGLFFGLCVSTKPLFLVLAPAVMIMAYFWRKKINFQRKTLILFCISFAIPVFLWLVSQFSFSDSIGSVFSHYSNPYAIKDLFFVIWNNFLRFFKEPSAIYFFGLFFVWGFSIVMRWKNKIKISLAEAISFGFSFLVILAYLRTAGWYRYFFTANFLALAYFPSSLVALLSLMPYIKKLSIRYIKIIVGGAVILLLIIHVYQLKYNSWVALYYNSHRSQEMSEYFGILPDRSSVYIYNVPEVLIFLRHANYYQYYNPIEGQYIGKETLGLIELGVPQYIVLSDNNFKAEGSRFNLYKIKDRINRYIILEKI